MQNIVEINQKSDEYMMLASNVMVALKDLASKEDEVSQSGIIIQRAQDKSVVADRNTDGKVVSVGKDVDELCVGDFVFWHITSGIEIKFIDGYFMVLDKDRILGKSK